MRVLTWGAGVQSKSGRGEYRCSVGQRKQVIMEPRINCLITFPSGSGRPRGTERGEHGGVSVDTHQNCEGIDMPLQCFFYVRNYSRRGWLVSVVCGPDQLAGAPHPQAAPGR